jgi:RHS repeat-associated protein
MLHFSVSDGTPDGSYGWAFTADGTSGGSYAVTVANGTVSVGQDWVIWVTPSYFWGPGVIGVVTVTGSEHVYVLSPTSAGFYPVDGSHDCCCDYGCTATTTYTKVIEINIGEGAPDENQTRECDLNTGCSTCPTEPMANYSIHLMLASLHIEDTPISYNFPRSSSTKFKVSYNQREANQPITFGYGNLGPKWTCNWLSYVTDDGPSVVSVSPAVYVRGGGTELFRGFDSGTQSYAPDRQTLAVLVRTSPGTYERRFPSGAKEVFSQSDGSISYPRRVFLTTVVDATGDPTTVAYDSSFRIRSITDSLGQAISLTYDMSADPLKITKVTDPFGRFATFEYTSGKLSRITDPIGIESRFGYAAGSDFIDSLTTPYGTSTFAKGESGIGMRWVEATDPLGGKERVEYNNAAPNIVSAEDSAPPGVYNGDLQLWNTFYWDKKAMNEAPGDYAKAQVFHWLATPEGKLAGVKHSEKKALENRIWYTYADQSDPNKVGRNALPIKMARLVEGGATQLSQSTYNILGNPLTETDPAGRVKSYRYNQNNIDVLEVYQRNPTGVSVDPDGQNADKIAAYTYNLVHEPLTESDAAGQVTSYTYDNFGQILTRTNAKNETTTYTYGGTVPAGYPASITSPPFNGVSAVTSFAYDGFRRVQKATNEADQSIVTFEYDSIDRKIRVSYPDETYEQFQYTDNVTGLMTLDLTGSRDRGGRWTYRHYDGNRKMDWITDPLGRTTRFGWCICGSLNSITDPNRNVTTFNRDLEGRVYQKMFPDSTTINYLFEGQTAPNTVGSTSRLKSSTDALNRKTNYSYFIDNQIAQINYTDSSGNPLNPPTPSVGYTYDSNYNRVGMMTDGTGLTTYSYHPVNSSPDLGAGRLESIDGPLANDTITFSYDELGRAVSHSIDGALETATYDSLGRLTTIRNPLGQFERAYDGVTQRLQTVTSRSGPKTHYTYYGNEHDRRLQSLQNVTGGTVNLSRFDYTYNAVGQITNWDKLLGTVSSGLWFDYDEAQQLVSVCNASPPSFASQRYDYGYDDSGNRMSDSNYDPHPVPSGGWLAGTFTTYTSNMLNQLDTRTMQRDDGPPVGSFLTYDLAGNLTDDGERMTLEWDAANRLVAVNYTDTTKRSEFTYDGLNRRVKIVEKIGATVTSTKKFVWIGSRIAQERDASDAITRRYFPEGEQQSGSGGGIRSYYYTHDHLGSIREVTNSAGEVLARYDYDPYGKRTVLPSKVQVDFGFSGHYHHTPSGLSLTLYRAYNPELGRWISRDPIGEKAGVNLYQDVQNDPINRVDPLGLMDFRYYGNWGGPGWTGGQWRAYENLTAPDIANLAPPVDAQDHCYMVHDICYSQCRTKNGCAASGRVNKDQITRENGCETSCDYNLASCLSNLERQNWHSRLGWVVFTWRYTIR